MENEPTTANSDAEQALLKPKRKLFTRPVFWVPATFLLLLGVVLGISAALLIPRAEAASQSLQEALPLATQAKDQILAGESDQAKVTVTKLSKLTAQAEKQTDYFLWSAAENTPFIGENLKAVRVVAHTVNTLSNDVLMPATEVSLSALRTQDGALDLEKIKALLPIVQNASQAAKQTSIELENLDDNLLVGPVKEGVLKLQDSISKLQEMVGPATDVLTILPSMLGSDGPRDYLFMFPNNAEIRAGGGNPASLSIVTADNGRISITQQASSSDFKRINLPINPETEELYDTRTRQMMQDATYTPYFAETAELMRGHWADSFGTPVDGVVSFDPVALSYLLAATGPISLPTGEELNSENAVPLLLNEVYFKYPVSQQDAFFAGAAKTVFSALTSGNADTRKLVDALVKAADEGRLMYSSYNEQEMKLIENTRISGPLPATNQPTTVLGVFYNYVLAAKMDYYLDSTVEGSTNMCTAQGDEPITFTASTTITNILTPEQLGTLPGYVVASNGGGAVYRDVMFYGPVGTEVKSVEVNGRIQQPFNRWPNNYRVMPHNGRQVVQVPLLIQMQESASVSVTFQAAKDQKKSSFGKFEVRATPTVWTATEQRFTWTCDGQ